MAMFARGAGASPVAGFTVPVTPGGLVCPSPVRKKVTSPPLETGLFGPFRLKLALKAPGPLPEEFSVKTPGDVALTARLMALDVWPRYLPSTDTVWNRATSYGTTADTCVPAT